MGATITAPPNRAMMKCDTYEGNGADDRDIDIGVDLASKSFAAVFVKARSIAELGVWHTSSLVGDLSLYMTDLAGLGDRIQTLTATGFQVGVNDEVNKDLNEYEYLAIWQNP